MLSGERRSSDANDLAAMLIAGGDSRLRLDRATGLNRYFCAPRPSSGTVCFASCTASPISSAGWRVAGEALSRLRPALGSGGRDRLQGEAASLAAQIGSLLGTTHLAAVFLTPSGTDATMLVIGLLAAERPGQPLVSVMAAAAETGAGVPLAAAGRHFSDIAAGMGRVETGELLRGLPPGMEAVHIALRHPTGAVRRRDEVDADFAAAAAAARGRPVVHLIDGSKTGLRAPHAVPPGADVIVDACQGRVPPARLRDYLLRGWPVLLTGSKFYGGPSFCGAVLFPRERLAAIDFGALPAGLGAYCSNMNCAQPAANAGTILRWAVAVEEMRRFTSMPAAQCRTRIAGLSERIGTWLRSAPGVVPIPMPEDEADEDPQGWPRSIHTFAVRDPMDPDRLLTMPQLRDIYRELAGDGVLVGQPVGIGTSYGGLRIAIGAATLQDSRIEGNLLQLFSSIERHTRPR